MKKETIIAIISGISFGVILSLFLISRTKDQSLEKTKTLTKEITGAPSITQKSAKTVTLDIKSPNEGDIYQKNVVAIKGKAEKKSLIVIQSSLSEKIFVNDKEDFSLEFPLALGENNINIFSYQGGKEGQMQEKDIKVYYIDE